MANNNNFAVYALEMKEEKHQAGHLSQRALKRILIERTYIYSEAPH